MFAGNFAPAGWMFCEGQLLAISENEILFQLIGTTYGGDGQSTFALPDLRGRIPIHQGNGYILAEAGGVEEVTLTVSQIPSHNHMPRASSGGGSSTSPANHVWAGSSVNQFTTSTAGATMGAQLQPTGGNQPHSNMQPYLCVNFIISLFGVFPSPT